MLRDEGEAYARNLRAAGVDVTATRYGGAIHDFMMVNALRETNAAGAAIAQAIALPRREALACSTLSTDHHPTLRHVDREAIGVELQAVLAILTDLALTGKHAHWNVAGPELPGAAPAPGRAGRTRGATQADTVAERAVALGLRARRPDRDDRRADAAARRSRPARSSTASCWSRSPASSPRRSARSASGWTALEDVDTVTARPPARRRRHPRRAGVDDPRPDRLTPWPTPWLSSSSRPSPGPEWSASTACRGTR